MKPEDIIQKAAQIGIARTRARLANTINDPEYRAFAYRRRLFKEDNWISKTRRQIFNMPPEMYEAAVKRYGAEIFRDKKLLKEILKRDEVLRSYLTVPLNTI